MLTKFVKTSWCNTWMLLLCGLILEQAKYSPPELRRYLIDLNTNPPWSLTCPIQRIHKLPYLCSTLFITVDSMTSSLMGLQCIIIFVALLTKVTWKSWWYLAVYILDMPLTMPLLWSKPSPTQTTRKPKTKWILYNVFNYLIIGTLQEGVSQWDT